MPRRSRVLVDGATFHVDCPFAHGARVFAAPEKGFERQVGAVEAKLRRLSCMSGRTLSLPTTPDPEVPIWLLSGRPDTDPELGAAPDGAI